jgi:hypothetical protein
MGTVDPKAKRKRRTPSRKGRGGPARLREHEEWTDFCDFLVGALRKFPEAKKAVEDAIRERLKNDEEQPPAGE